MYSLTTRYPDASVGLAAVLDRAAREAEAVPGAYASAPWRFLAASPAATALLDGREPSAEGWEARWVVVVCRRGDAGGHVKERAFTAVQRYLLSLAAEGVEATWMGAGLPMGLEREVATEPGEDVIGVIRVVG